MNINGKKISSFGAKVERKLITPSDIDVTAKWLPKALLPKLVDKISGFKTIEIELLFEAKTRDLIYKNISNFMCELAECHIKFRNLSNNFHCFLVSAKPKESDFDDWLFLDLEFEGYEYSNEIEINIENSLSKQFSIEGNRNTPVIVEITPKNAIIDFKIEGLNEDGITIKNLKANQKVIIDGVNSTITEGSSNKSKDVDLWEFPFLVVGRNTIKLSRSDVNVKIKYKPLWQ